MTKQNKDDPNSPTSISGLFDASNNTDIHDPAQTPQDQTLCGDLDIHIDTEGMWFYHGSPIGRKELVKLFATVLNIDEEGRYWLITPAEKGEITVEDVPFQAVEMTVTGENAQQTLTFRTNIDEIVIADKAHPIRIETDPETEEPSPYIMVRDGLEARLTRSVFYQMVELGVEWGVEMAQGEDIFSKQSFGVWSSGQFFLIGTLTEND